MALVGESNHQIDRLEAEAKRRRVQLHVVDFLHMLRYILERGVELL